MDRPMIIRWISEVPSKIVKIRAVRAEPPVHLTGRITCETSDNRSSDGPYRWGYPCPLRSPAELLAPKTAAERSDEILREEFATCRTLTARG
jgi:hypothetical protein